MKLHPQARGKPRSAFSGERKQGNLPFLFGRQSLDNPRPVMHSMQVSIRAQKILVLQMTNFATRWRGTQKGYSVTVGQQFFINAVATQSKLLSMLSRKCFLNPSHRQSSSPQKPSTALSTFIFLMRTLLLKWRRFRLLSRTRQTLRETQKANSAGPGLLPAQ